MKAVTLVCISVCLSALPMSTACADNSKATAEAPGFHFTVELIKSIYLEGEPVLAKCSITNDSGKPMKLVEPERGWHMGVEWEVFRLPNKEKMWHPERNIESIGPPPPKDWYWEFRPGETRFTYVSLLYHVDEALLKPGDYVVSFEYSVYHGVQADWVGSLKTKELRFQVVAPQGNEANTLAEYRRLLSDIKNTERRSEIGNGLIKLGSQKTSGRYAAWIGLGGARVLARADRKAGITALKDYYRANINQPYYNTQAIEAIAQAYADEREYETAREWYLKLPESRYRREVLETLKGYAKRWPKAK